jgi:hypothetical protein
MDTHHSYYGTETYHEFVRLYGEIFAVEQQMRALGYEDTRLALHRARIELGHEETRVRREYTIQKRQEEGL